MNTTADKLNLLLQTKANLKAALIEQGQPITDDTPFSEYPDYVLAIAGNPVVKRKDVFGVMWDYSNPSTALTRLTPDNDPNGFVTVKITSEPVPAVGGGEGASPFDIYMPWAGMEEYNIINGEVLYEQGHNNFSRTSYDTMVFIPEFWFLVIDNQSESKRYWYISNEAKDGFAKHPGSGRYVGRYTTIAGYYSKSGAAPLVSITRAAARTGSMSKGDNWCQYDFATWNAVCLLYLLEYANWDSQSKIGRGCVEGVNAAIYSGSTDGMAYHTGHAVGQDGTVGVQYRHIENLWGNVHQFVDGVNFNDRVSYICLDPSKYVDDTVANYFLADITLPSKMGFIKKLGFSMAFPFAFLPNEIGGSETTYIPDTVYNGSGWRVLFVGGRVTFGSNAGLFCFAADSSSSFTYSYLGSRLLYIPG